MRSRKRNIPNPRGVPKKKPVRGGRPKKKPRQSTTTALKATRSRRIKRY